MILMQADIDEEQVSMIVVILESDNLARMEQADPITLESGMLGGFLKPVKYPAHVRLMLAYEKDMGPIYEMLQNDRKGELLAHLMRGYNFSRVDGIATTKMPKEVS